MADQFVAEVRMFGFGFAPTGWAACNGQLLPLSQNTALFSLLGTFYGGNGTSNFALPNLQDQFAVGMGSGPGLSQRSLGEQGGEATVALSPSTMPQHTHALKAGAAASSTNPTGAVMAPPAGGALEYRIPANPTPMAGASLANAGNGQPHENRQPFLAVNFCIAMQGIYPARG
ncbi:phage tail protein [Roseateles koreensis]|uniref:Tail fiber protein n=1 Tax=Roseateles koreensis TaxID=2987526 RepID=A0ABT5KXC8_9BURK|nr:tail fiber protein [Roseateles koreensis]MDC8787075.1 tail fiber protein [Roseateles koreensis]